VLLALSTAWLGAQAGGGASDPNALRSRVDRRFQILPIANGVVLTPRFTTPTRSIEIADGTIAVDGVPVTGAELQNRLGADAQLVLQVSYLDPAARRIFAGLQAAPSTSPAPTPPSPPTIESSTPSPAAAGRPERPRRREAVVRIGGNVQIASDEHVTDDVVIVGGRADVDGRVDGDVVVVGGSATLGPNADIGSDVTVIGGSLNQDPKALVGGKVQNIGFGEIGGDWHWRNGDWRGWEGFPRLRPAARFIGTIVRVGLVMLFAALILFVARTPVEQVADRVAAEPLKSWVVGVLAEVLFVPIVTLTCFVLAVSIIGIPVLILLIPVAIVGAILLFLLGFTGVAYHAGRLLQAKVDYLRARPYAAMLAGIGLIVAPLLLGRIVGLTGEMGFLVMLLGAVGVVIEYIAWTAGLGAAALVRFAPKPVGPIVQPAPPASATS
jgi:hypothetical protein